MSDWREAFLAKGIDPPPEIDFDGTIKRFSTNGRPSDTAGWYVGYRGQVADYLSFGDWRSGAQGRWCSKKDKDISPVWREQMRQEKRRMEDLRAAALAKARAVAAEMAMDMLDRSMPAPEEHEYLARKHIPPDDLRVLRGEILLPIQIDGKLSSLQRIDEEGGKTFLPGGAVRGGYTTIGLNGHADTLLICEGYATGVSLRRMTGKPVVVAFSAGNLQLVARTMRERFPEARIVIAGDNDTQTKGNPGKAAATAAAKSIGGVVAIPEAGGDWNDAELADAQKATAAIMAAVIDRKAASMQRIDMSALLSEEPPPKNQSLIAGEWMPKGYITLLHGHGGLGKSSIASLLGIAACTATPWLGLDLALTEGINVLYLSCEDRSADILRRIYYQSAAAARQQQERLRHDPTPRKSWNQQLRELRETIAKRLHIICTHDISSVLWEPKQGLTEFGKYLRRYARDHEIGLVIFDGLADVYAGNENARTEAKQAINGLSSIIGEDGYGLLLGHESLQNIKESGTNPAGTTGWHNSVRARWGLSREKLTDDFGGTVDDPTGDCILTLHKAQYGQPGAQIRVSWSEADGCHTGINIAAPSPSERVRGYTDNDLDQLHDLVRACNRIGIDVPTQENRKEYGSRGAIRPALAKAGTVPSCFDKKPQALRPALRELEQAGKIQIILGPRSESSHRKPELWVSTEFLQERERAMDEESRKNESARNSHSENDSYSKQGDIHTFFRARKESSTKKMRVCAHISDGNDAAHLRNNEENEEVRATAHLRGKKSPVLLARNVLLPGVKYLNSDFAALRPDGMRPKEWEKIVAQWKLSGQTVQRKFPSTENEKGGWYVLLAGDQHAEEE